MIEFFFQVFSRTRITRFGVDCDIDELVDVQTVIDDIPGAPWHDGGRIAFGPDEKLYITTGDAVNPGWSQDLTSLARKEPCHMARAATVCPAAADTAARRLARRAMARFVSRFTDRDKPRR